MAYGPMCSASPHNLDRQVAIARSPALNRTAEQHQASKRSLLYRLSFSSALTAIFAIEPEAMANEVELALHHHGKSRVRLGRVWREGNVHHFVEWMVHTMIESDMEAAFIEGDNTGMTPTDTQKNTVSCWTASLFNRHYCRCHKSCLPAGVRGR